MYPVDESDQVHELSGVPQSSVGAPIPVVLGDERSLHLVYFVQNTPEGWDGSTVRVVGLDTKAEPLAVVTFRACYASMFGPPNDEAFAGHPLADRGLHPYSAFEIRPSSWLRQLERMNSVHPHHKPERFDELRHFVFAFHDSTFECVAESIEVESRISPVAEVLKELSVRLCQ